VILLWGYHLTCGHYVKQFAGEKNTRSAYFYRIFNELPTVSLVLIVFAVVLKP
jgi:putative membrane protein